MEGQKSTSLTDFTIQEDDVGVYRVKIARQKRQLGDIKSLFATSHVKQRFGDGKKAGSDIFRFLGDVYSISPIQFTVVVGGNVWNYISKPLDAYFRSMLLQAVETSLKTDEPDQWGIIMSLSLFFLSSMAESFMRWTLMRNQRVFHNKITSHFHLRLLRESLTNDLASATAKDGHETVTAGQARQQFVILCVVFSNVIGVLGHLALIFDICRRVGDPLLILLSLVLPIVASLWWDSIYLHKCIAYNNSEPDKRMKALAKLSERKYKQDIVLGNMVEWIMTEFKKAFKARGDVAFVQHPLTEWNNLNSHARSKFLRGAVKDLPLIYLALLSILNPFAVSLSSITVLAESSLRLMEVINSPFLSLGRIQIAVTGIRRLYYQDKASSSTTNGALSYPVRNQFGEEDGIAGSTSRKGMRIELRNVSFTYPSSQSTQPALDNVSFAIHPGQLVVLVGKNGSGKSTLIRILSRLYEQTSGEVLIDDRPSSAYDLGDIKQAMTLLSQDNKVFPLSLKENIGVGYPERYTDGELIQAATEDGGATGLIGKLKDGLETVLDPKIDTFSMNLHNEPNHPLAMELEEITKKIDISGGEKQRIVASRTFMRMSSGNVNFVAVDEPTSALDADGELHLFKRLAERREGKTMVFVTHRFGHLTKHADLILCMDEGNLVESGSHEQLMKRNGVYSTLYTAQASVYSH
ncbi:P-loop containing nucleoside triphosphate hydrolase protein [Panaeolus papilionaceus]|nr:P-loop containing nucleoside triphosphate hydrolase protein [Panaeolus papilionaceus]